MSIPTSDRADSDILPLPITRTVESALIPSCQIFIDPAELIRIGRSGQTLIVSVPCQLKDVSVTSGLAAAALRRTP